MLIVVAFLRTPHATIPTSHRQKARPAGPVVSATSLSAPLRSWRDLLRYPSFKRHILGSEDSAGRLASALSATMYWPLPASMPSAAGTGGGVWARQPQRIDLGNGLSAGIAEVGLSSLGSTGGGSLFETLQSVIAADVDASLADAGGYFIDV